MIHYQQQMPTGIEHNPAGGAGDMFFQTLFAPADLDGKTGMFAAVTLQPGVIVGSHTHTDDCEVFYILEGEAVMMEDGKPYPVKAGDIEFCPKGHSHGIENHSDQPVKFMALQLKY